MFGLLWNMFGLLWKMLELLQQILRHSATLCKMSCFDRMKTVRAKWSQSRICAEETVWRRCHRLFPLQRKEVHWLHPPLLHCIPSTFLPTVKLSTVCVYHEDKEINGNQSSDFSPAFLQPFAVLVQLVFYKCGNCTVQTN